MKIFITNIFYIFIFFIIFSGGIYSKTCKSCCVTGNWNSASTWIPSGVPACGDTVIIQTGHTVSVTTQQNYSTCISSLKIYVYGHLKFFNGSKLRLSCGSYVVVAVGGLVEADVGLSNSNLIEICDVVEWNSNTVLDGYDCIPHSHPVCASVLPIELIYFKAETCDFNKICFNWETATEKNNNHFEIERSKNAVDFWMVITLPSKALGGNSQYKISYKAIDETPLNGVNYYRLKQVDNNQIKTNSKIISVHSVLEKGLQFLIFPNSNSGAFTAQIIGLNKAGNLSIIIRNPSGSILYKALHHVDETFSEINVVPDVKLDDGFYYCSFIIEDTEHVMKFIVESF
jgi:hypothetical protein